MSGGRFINDQDRLGSQAVAVVDEVMAQQAFGGDDPIGRGSQPPGSEPNDAL